MPHLSRASGLVLLAAVFLAWTGTAAAQCPPTPPGPDEKTVTITRQGNQLKVDIPCLQIKGGKHTIHWVYTGSGGDPLIIWAKTSPFDAANKPKHQGKHVRSGKAPVVSQSKMFPYSIVVPVPGGDPIVLDPDVEVIP
jgi:hypothetical protein